MPEISRFYGIVITMYYDDHNPPHFHARYGENKAVIAISSLRILEGRLPARVLGFDREVGVSTSDRIDGQLECCAK